VDAYEAILTRRSIRNYTRQPVSVELIRQLMVAAMCAPSAGNEQPWHFIVVTQREQLDALAEVLPYGKMLRQAPLAVVVCGDPKLQTHEGFWVQDCSAATQNILMAAHAKGLGAVWVGVYPKEERIAGIRRLMGVPEHVVPLCVVSIGYAASRVEPVNRYQEARIHLNR
jgi:nitroreductase